MRDDWGYEITNDASLPTDGGGGIDPFVAGLIGGVLTCATFGTVLWIFL